MTVTAKCLAETQAVPASATTLYTAPVGTRTYIDKLTLTNTAGAPATVVVNIVPSGGSAATANAVTASQTIAANGVYTFPEIAGHILNPGDFVSVTPSATGCNARMSGREMQ